tara:strand:- start:1231 stop:1533 length:303 start_codon:yes stop_codon:yes gene_type:complete
MNYLTHNDKEINFMGTSYVGEIIVNYNKLVDVFGKSQSWDDYKTDAHWTIEFEDGEIATIYNWKNGVNYLGKEGSSTSKIKEWNIGGRSSDVVERIKSLL